MGHTEQITSKSRLNRDSLHRKSNFLSDIPAGTDIVSAHGHERTSNTSPLYIHVV